ncbi:GAP family protein [Gordonia sp. CPCC 206044]|uniref:GAP family protein n=1 Tax=Gordonia sp. CPCC 206044 TaxID=3140793 RepID=UPI003AF347C6
MGAVIGDLLPFAVGVAISPIPIIGAILMLLGKRARTTSIGFAIGWLAGIVIATTIFVFLGGAFGDSTSTATAWIKLALGVALLAEGIREWRVRGVDHGTPKWMTAIDDMKPVTALGLGFALAAINPKNLMMCIGAGVTVGGAALSVGSDVVAVAVFSILAATTVVIPVVAYQVAADRLRGPLDRLKAWLEANNKSVMATLILVIAVVLIGKGISGLA